MSCQVNPAFISAYQKLKYAAAHRNDSRQAEVAFHKAEADWCNQKGIIDGGNLTENAAMARVNNIMNEVHSWYV